MVDQHVKSLYDMATRATAARDEMREAAMQGRVAQYHRVLREVPEVAIVAPLAAVRRQVSELSAARRRLMSAPARDPVRQQNEVDELTKAMSTVAHGTLLWANEQLGVAASMGSTSDMNSGEEQ